MRKAAFPIIMAVVGIAILLGLGIWQVQRLQWKTAILGDIEARIVDEAVPLPGVVDQEAHRYMPVFLPNARLTGDELHVLVAAERGAGYRIIAAVEVENRLILADLGFAYEAARTIDRAADGLAITGNLHWPDEVDGYTPDPDLGRNIWFARDVQTMAQALGTEPVMVIARQIEPPPPGTAPLPLGASGIANDHLEYAITWFSLALVWAVMSGFLIRRALSPALKD
ncbi:MAG: SURF1 family protein [Rhodobacteraceae bacterium]|nr:SURF1 family protein [Paracoccaceae bacterium]